MDQKYKRLFSDTLLFALSNFGSKFLIFLLVPLYTHVLTTAEYGTADIVTTTVNLLIPILTLSICEATLRFALDKRNEPQKVLSNSLILTGFAIVVVLAVTPIIRLVSEEIFDYWWCFVAVFSTGALQTVFANYLKGRELTKLYAVQGCIYTIVLIACNILFLLVFQIRLYGYLISIAIANLFCCLFMCVAGKLFRDLKNIKADKILLHKMISYSMPMTLSSVAWWINSSADKYMLIGIVGIGASGLYAVAHKIPTIFSTFTGLFSQAWRISAISNYEDSEKDEYYSIMYRFYTLVCMYVCLAITLSSQLIAAILFSSDFYDAWCLVSPLLLAAVFEAFAGFLASIYAAINKTKILAISTCVGALFNIALNAVFIYLLGMLGAPIATFLSFIVVCVIRTVILEKYVHFKINYLRLIISLIVLIVANLIFAFDFPYKYIWYVISALLIFAINAKDTQFLFHKLLSILSNIKMKRKSI